MPIPRVVIVGGGFGGLFAARSFERALVRVTLLDRHNYHLFQPLLYQVATAELSPADVASPIRWILRRQQNVEVLLAEVLTIDPIGQRVLLDHDEPLSFDYLILATGATHSYFGHDEWAPRAPGLKTLDDALSIRQRVLLAFEAAERTSEPAAQERLLTFVIIGGGPTGVELAGALAEIAKHSLRHDFRRIRPESASIILLEGSPQILGTFPEPLREAARRSLERLGVDVRTHAKVIGVDDEGVTIESVAQADAGLKPRATSVGSTERIEAKTILWAAGVAASPLATSLGVPLDRAGRVATEPTLAVPGHPRVYVVGDLCAFVDRGTPLPGVAQVAMQQGAHAAQNIVRAIEGKPQTPFHYKDYGIMATIGRGAAVGDIFGLKVSGLLAWFFWLFLHIFWLIGFRNRLAVMSEWAWAYLTFQRRVRLITSDKPWNV